VLVPTDAVGAVGIPVREGLASGAFSAKLLTIVVLKFASLLSAVASSFRVSRAPGEDATRSATADATNAVVAICVVFVPLAAVGALGVPVRDGFASGAFKSKADCVFAIAVDTN